MVVKGPVMSSAHTSDWLHHTTPHYLFSPADSEASHTPLGHVHAPFLPQAVAIDLSSYFLLRCAAPLTLAHL
jgi:hypothetical protein